VSGLRQYKIISWRKLAAARAADLLVDTAGRLGVLPRRPGMAAAPLPEQAERILAVRLAYTGDVILTLPALAPLRRRYPAARIMLATNGQAAELLRGHPDIDEVVPFDAPWFYPCARLGKWRAIRRFVNRVKRLRPDIGIDFRADVRDILVALYLPGIPHRVSYTSGGGECLLTHPVPWERWKHKLEFHLDIVRGAGIPAESTAPRIPVPADGEAELLEACPQLEEQIKRPLIALHPGARVELKRWPAVNYRRLADGLSRRTGARIAVTGSADERQLGEEVLAGLSARSGVNLCGRLSIRALAALYARADVVVSNDSMPIHLAAAVGGRVAAIFGPSKPRETAPLGAANRVIVKPFPCRYTCDESRCGHERHRACLEAITAHEVLQTVGAMLI